MTYHIEYEASKELEFDYEELVKKVIEASMDYEKCPYESEISILFTDDAQIRQINHEFRGIDKATDVLSFPAVEYVEPGAFDHLEEDDIGNFHPETGELILGDIVMSVEKAIVQAQEFGHSIEREIAFLTAHSMFHLFGYDHMEEAERNIMEQKQSEVLELLGISR